MGYGLCSIAIKQLEASVDAEYGEGKSRSCEIRSGTQ
jgi:hypothetical protein